MASKRYYRTRYGWAAVTSDPDRISYLENNDAERITKEDFMTDRKEQIKQYVSEGDTLYTQVVQVSRSGMSRHIRVFAIVDNDPVRLSTWAAEILEWRYLPDDDSIMVSGCGMDMGFHTVYSLSYALFGDGYKLSQKWL